MNDPKKPVNDGYRVLSADLKQHLEAGGESSAAGIRDYLSAAVDRLAAQGDWDRQELHDSAQYVGRDFGEAAGLMDGDGEAWETSPTWLSLKNGFWRWLLELSDRTAIEWREVALELRHGGHYQKGEMVGIGVLTCERCGHEVVYDHPQPVVACIKCGATRFQRSPLAP